MEALEVPVTVPDVWQDHEDDTSPANGDGESGLRQQKRREKRLRRQKLAKLYKRAAVQVMGGGRGA
jgi:hypothetical protein